MDNICIKCGAAIANEKSNVVSVVAFYNSVFLR